MIAKVVVFALCCFAVFQHLEATSNGLCPDATGTATNAVCPLACQFQNNGSFTPNAFDCEDDLGSTACATLFPCSGSCSTINGLSTVTAMVPTTQPYVRAYACTAPSTQTLALQCAKTCGICCLTSKFNCTDDSRSPINCAANQGNCRNAAFKDIMTQYCPYTCGLCGGNCKDNATGCSTLTGLCQNINWYQYMSQNCASTCGMCNSTTTNSTTGNCADVATNCAANANLCNNSVYYSLMTQQCPRTCNRCGQSSSSSSTTCTDSSANCATWAKNGFCSSTFYTSTYKRQYCAKTCSLC
uniref:ShKT domain-containing protein n=1 Tax=Panagrolaimus sp. JU765 TaxID=591449 RepID=A0AC34QU00_9BILA